MSEIFYLLLILVGIPVFLLSLGDFIDRYRKKPIKIAGFWIVLFLLPSIPFFCFWVYDGFQNGFEFQGLLAIAIIPIAFGAAALLALINIFMPDILRSLWGFIFKR